MDKIKKKTDKKEAEPKGKNSVIDLEPTLNRDDNDVVNEAAPLTIAQRRKRAISLRIAQPKIQRGRRIAQRKMATRDKLKVRARKKAIEFIKKKVAGKKGGDYKNLSPGEKANIDRQVEKRKGSIGKIAQRLLPKVTKAERERLKSYLAHRNEEMENDVLDIILENIELVNEEPSETPKKKFHMLFTKDKKPKTDGRFKIYKKKEVSEENLLDMFEDIQYNVINERFEKLFEQEAVKSAQDRIKREKEIDKKKHDTMLDRARLNDARKKNMQTEARFSIKSIPRSAENALISKKFDKYGDDDDDDACAVISAKELKELEKFADGLLDKFGIDIEFTKHFGERMSDSRNNPCITVKELRDFFRKIYANQGKKIKSVKDHEAVLKDLQKSLNIPVVIDVKKGGGDLEVRLKTIMRKKNFTSPDKSITYEETEFKESVIGNVLNRKRYDAALKLFIKKIKDDPKTAAFDVAREAGVDDVRGFISYVKKQVSKGLAPKDLLMNEENDYEMEE